MSVHTQKRRVFETRDRTQQNGWKSEDGRMTREKCRARLRIPGLARHFLVRWKMRCAGC